MPKIENKNNVNYDMNKSVIADDGDEYEKNAKHYCCRRKAKKKLKRMRVVRGNRR